MHLNLSVSNLIVKGCNLSFTRSLKVSYLGWIIFGRLNVVKDFSFSFSSLTLHAVNLLLQKKIISLTLFKTITASRPSTVLRVFPKGRLWCPVNGGNWQEAGWGDPWKPKSLNFCLLLDITPTKKSPHVHPMIIDHIYWLYILVRQVGHNTYALSIIYNYIYIYIYIYICLYI